MFSVIIPTYNRLPILQKCLIALENQTFSDYEIIVVDDGSTDKTIEWITENKDILPHVKIFLQEHQGAAAARNLGIKKAQGEIIVFIDSDLIVTEIFLEAHAQALNINNNLIKKEPVFTYGEVINTCNFDNPTSEKYKITDYSRAYFATGNVAIHREWLEEAGLFDTSFQLYGWEDLELGVRLKKLGLKLIKCPEAVGYHWHPPFNLEQLPQLIEQEKQRGKMGVLFYQKHPNWDVKMMIQMTILHRILWNLLTLGGILNEHSLKPLLQVLIKQNKPQLALEIARIFLNLYNVKAVYKAWQEVKT